MSTAGPAPAPPSLPDARGKGRFAGPGARGLAAAKESREGVKYHVQTQPRHTHVSPPKPYPQKRSLPPKAALPEGRTRPVCAPARKCTLLDITLPKLQRRVVQAGHEGTGGHGDRRGGRGGDDNRAGRGAKRGGTGSGAEGKRGKVAVGGGGGQVPSK